MSNSDSACEANDCVLICTSTILTFKQSYHIRVEGNVRYAARKLGSVVGSVEWHFITMIAKVSGRGRIVAFNGMIQAISAYVLRTGNLSTLLQRSGSHGVKHGYAITNVGSESIRTGGEQEDREFY